MIRLSDRRLHTCALAAILAATAALAPEPWYPTDREQYQEIGRAIVLQDCSALHCFRLLVPAVLEQLPGPSVLKWKIFAIVGNTWAAVAVADLALVLGLSSRAALLAMWLSGIGFGALFTLFDPYSADPLMFLLGPVLTTWLLQGRLEMAGLVSAAGVFAKEFAAAPLWVSAGASVVARRWYDAARIGTIAFAVTVLWLLLQVTLMVGFNNSYGDNPSANVLGGGYIAHWFEKLGMRTGLTALFTEYGPLYFLLPLGVIFANQELRRLTLASLPALAAFMYVQQPDRALWNFHFIVTPLAALVLERVPIGLVLAVLVSFGVGNLRLAAQLQFMPAARYALALSIVLACTAAFIAWKAGRLAAPKLPPWLARDWNASFRRRAVRYGGQVGEAGARSLARGYRVLLAASVAAAVLSVLVLGDMAAHTAVELDRGLNRHGYRGPVLRAKSDSEIRIVVVGGATASSHDIGRGQSLVAMLWQFLEQRWRWKEEEFLATSVADLSQPPDTAARAAEALRDYRYLAADIVCIITGHNDLPGASLPSGGRRDAAVFRAVGYLPALPAMLTGKPLVPPDPELPVDVAWIAAHVRAGHPPAIPGPCPATWSSYCGAVAEAVDYSLSERQRVLVVSEPYISGAHLAQQRALAALLAERYGSNRRVQYVDLGWQVNLLDGSVATEGWKLTRRGIEEYADGLFNGVHAMVTRPWH